MSTISSITSIENNLDIYRGKDCMKKFFEFLKIRKFKKTEKLLLADAFENFSNTFLEIYELDSAKFFSASGLAWQVP